MKASALAVSLLLFSGTAFAQHRHHHHHGHYRPSVGIYLGVPYPVVRPWYPPAYYAPPVVYPQPLPYSYYQAPAVVYPPPVQEAPVYIEQNYVEQNAAVAPPVQHQPSLKPGYWYYCEERSAYYPAVQNCPGPWQAVGPASNQNR